MSLRQRALYPIRHFLDTKGKILFVNNLNAVKSKDLIRSIPKPTSLILNPSSRTQNLSLLPQAFTLIHKADNSSSSKFGRYLFFFISPSSILYTIMVAANDDMNNNNQSSTSNGIKAASSFKRISTFFAIHMGLTEDEKDFVYRGLGGAKIIDMSNLDILKDNNFYDYLLQSLYDHYAKLRGTEHVTARLDFSPEFFKSYWQLLMQHAGIDNYLPVTEEDHLHHDKMLNGFDSIHRSLFAVCESHMNLRVTTKFVLEGRELDDKEQIDKRVLLMLVLLFVSKTVAHHKGCEDVTLKEPRARLVYACFSKLFKDIYHGDDELFKNYIFAEENDHSPSTSFTCNSSPNRSLNRSNLDTICITPYAKKVQNYITAEENVLDDDEIMKKQQEDSENRAAENQALQECLTSNLQKILEMKNLQESSQKTIKELEDRVCQNELVINNMHIEKQALNDVISKLQDDLDSMAIEVMEKEKNDEIMKKQQEDSENRAAENQALQECLTSNLQKILEMKNLQESSQKTIKELEDRLCQNEFEINNMRNENQSLNDVISKLQDDLDSMAVEVMEKEKNEDLIKVESNQKILEMKNLQESSQKTIKELEDRLCQNEFEINNMRNENQSLNDVISKLQDDLDSMAVEVMEKEKNEDLIQVESNQGRNSQQLQEEVFPQPSLSGRCRSSAINWMMFLFSLLLLFSIYLYSFGALIPSFVYINVHHDRLPPQ